VGIAIWSAGMAPRDVPPDEIFTRFVLAHLPAGLVGLVIAGILAAAMSSSISALASSVTHDLYASWTRRSDPIHLFKVGRAFSAAWGVGLILMALAFHYSAVQRDTPVVVLALSIASVTYGVLLGGYLLAAVAGSRGADVIVAALITMPTMLVVLFARALAVREGLEWLAPAGRLAWPWYVPLGTLLMVATGILSSRARRARALAA
jgi:Na+/proline symporter